MYIYIYIFIAYYILPIIEGLLIARDAYMFSHKGPRTKAQEAVGRGLGDAAPWALGPGPEPISSMAEHMCTKISQQAI